MISGFRVIDLHVHSHLSGCADDEEHYSTASILRAAAALGVDGVGFADHVLEPQPGLPAELLDYLGGRPGLERVAALREELADIDLRSLPPVAVGAEVDVYGRGLSAITPVGRASLDHAAFSANHPQAPGTPAPDSESPEDIARHIMKRTREAVRSGLATSLAHPLIPMDRPASQEVYACYLPLGVEHVFEEARDAGVALGFSRHLVTHAHFARPADAAEIYQAAARVGVKLAFETDSHALWHLACITPLVALAERMGLAPKHFISELPAAS